GHRRLLVREGLRVRDRLARANSSERIVSAAPNLGRKLPRFKHNEAPSGARSRVGSKVRKIQTHGAGHVVRAAVSYTAPNGPDASREMVRSVAFSPCFREHQKEEPLDIRELRKRLRSSSKTEHGRAIARAYVAPRGAWTDADLDAFVATVTRGVLCPTEEA